MPQGRARSNGALIARSAHQQLADADAEAEANFNDGDYGIAGLEMEYNDVMDQEIEYDEFGKYDKLEDYPRQQISYACSLAKYFSLVRWLLRRVWRLH